MDHYTESDTHLVECAECGHLHYDPAAREYLTCTVCTCGGQS